MSKPSIILSLTPSQQWDRNVEGSSGKNDHTGSSTINYEHCLEENIIHRIKKRVRRRSSIVHENNDSECSNASSSSDGKGMRNEGRHMELFDEPGFRLDGIESASLYIDDGFENEYDHRKGECSDESDSHLFSDNSLISSMACIFAIILPAYHVPLEKEPNIIPYCNSSNADKKKLPENDAKRSSSSSAYLSYNINDMNSNEVEDLIKKIHPQIQALNFIGVISVSPSHYAKVSSSVGDTVNMQNLSTYNIVLLHNVLNNGSNIDVMIDGLSIDSSPKLIIKTIPLSSIQVRSDEKSHQSSCIRRSSKLFRIPNCPVCLHRIDPRHLGMLRPKAGQLCSQHCMVDLDYETRGILVEQSIISCRNRRCLIPWPAPFHCLSCQAIDQYNNLTQDTFLNHSSTFSLIKDCGQPKALHNILSCSDCRMTQTLWVCLTCGYVGCGRYTFGHAAKHYLESNHRYSLELVTERIWDYVSDTFVHRSDFLECAVHRQESAFVDVLSPGNAHDEAENENIISLFGKVDGESGTKGVTKLRKSQHIPLEKPIAPKKAFLLSEEYECLLQSALAEQAMYYEDLIANLCSELAAEGLDRNKVSAEETAEVEAIQADIESLRIENKSLSLSIANAYEQQTSYQEKARKWMQEQNENKNKLDQLKNDTMQERDEGEAQVAELQQQISDLTAFISVQQQICDDDELCEAQILSTFPQVSQKSKRNTKKGKRHKGKKR